MERTGHAVMTTEAVITPRWITMAKKPAPQVLRGVINAANHKYTIYFMVYNFI